MARHAGATRVTLSLAIEGPDVVLRVEDDGRGLDAETSRRGLGLLGMKERASALSGEVVIAPAPRRGTIVTVRVPASSAGAPGASEN